MILSAFVFVIGGSTLLLEMLLHMLTMSACAALVTLTLGRRGKGTSQNIKRTGD